MMNHIDVYKCEENVKTLNFQVRRVSSCTHVMPMSMYISCVFWMIHS
jgi:hypothetical protein